MTSHGRRRSPSPESIFGSRGRAVALYVTGMLSLPASLWAASMSYPITSTTGTSAFAWISGSKKASAGAVYHAIWPWSELVPGGRRGAVSWVGVDGGLWLFGGQGMAGASFGDLNDLWKYSPASGKWTWVSGSDTAGVSGSYGRKGVAATTNEPCGREQPISWADDRGNLWLFGGGASDSGRLGELNDLWRYSPATGQWVWLSGSEGVNAKGGYGTEGVAAAANAPGARYQSVSWTDDRGNLWLFGGSGFDSKGTAGMLNDLWMYSTMTGRWTWIGGSELVNARGMYGARAAATVSMLPGARRSAVSWTDRSGNLWVFGGLGLDSNGKMGDLNDLWKYAPSSNTWTWISGSDVANAKGVYGNEGVAGAMNVPGARFGSVSWTDTGGNLWLFGGYGFDSRGTPGYLNDLWKYSPASGRWSWVGGSNSTSTRRADRRNVTGVYGTEGVAALANVPGARQDAVSWIDVAGTLWLFGGYGYDGDTEGTTGPLNDLWKHPAQ